LSDDCVVVAGEQLSHSDLFAGITFLVTHLDRSSSTASPHPGINFFAAGGNYSRPHSLAIVGDYRHRIYAIYVGGT